MKEKSKEKKRNLLFIEKVWIGDGILISILLLATFLERLFAWLGSDLPLSDLFNEIWPIPAVLLWTILLLFFQRLIERKKNPGENCAFPHQILGFIRTLPFFLLNIKGSWLSLLLKDLLVLVCLLVESLYLFLSEEPLYKTSFFQKKRRRFFAFAFPILTLYLAYAGCILYLYLGGAGILLNSFSPLFIALGSIFLFLSLSAFHYKTKKNCLALYVIGHFINLLLVLSYGLLSIGYSFGDSLLCLIYSAFLLFHLIYSIYVAICLNKELFPKKNPLAKE